MDVVVRSGDSPLSHAANRDAQARLKSVHPPSQSLSAASAAGKLSGLGSRRM